MGPFWKEPRHWFAVALASAIVVVLVVMFLTVRVCEDQMATTGDSAGPFKVCRRLTLTDPPIAVLGAVLVALIGAFYTEISGFGITLKRAVSDARTAAEKAGSQAEAARESVMALHNALSVQILTLRNEMQQVSNLRASQSVVLNLRDNEYELPLHAKSMEDTARGAADSSALEQLRLQRAYQDYGLREVHDKTRAALNHGVRVAIIGAIPGATVLTFPAFRRQVKEPYICSGASPEHSSRLGAVTLGHILAMEPEARILPVSILDENYGTDVTKLTEGLIAATKWNPDVLLLGFGGDELSTPEIDKAITIAASDMLVVAPAGNDQRQTAAWPARLPGVLAVGALGEDGRWATFSNRGPAIELAAPGVNVTNLIGIDASGQPELGLMSGTSISADLVVGVASVLVARVGLQAKHIANILKSTANVHEGIPALNPVETLKRI